MSDDTLFGADIELDSFVALGLRFQYDLDSGVYFVTQQSYGRLDVTASFGSVSESADDWAYGFGVGAGFKFTEQAWAELGFERFESGDVLSLGFRYAF